MIFRSFPFGYDRNPIIERCCQWCCMGETQIEWTYATWNPVAGCTVVSAGCTHCYAMEMARRLESMRVSKYEGLTRKSGGRTVWKEIGRASCRERVCQYV